MRLGRALLPALVAAVFCCAVAPVCAAKPAPQRTFESPEAASQALIDAAERFDVPALTDILGEAGLDLVVTEDRVQSENLAKAFAAEAKKKTVVERDPDNPRIATITLGDDAWPAPIPIVEKRGAWRFDTESGRKEILFRRIGRNELDAIEVCRGYVEAQREYALEKHDAFQVNQYARRIISTPGTHDGLAWQDADGQWHGPVGEAIARVIAEGYSGHFEPYHGYYFKILEGQGPAAPLGAIDFVVGGAMIGGFALVAAPAEYGVTGIQTFMVSHDGVVYEKDLGSKTLETFKAMRVFNPDKGWKPVE
jgi:hypothetical protein